eukprot:3737-Eustigmatos_ZCMA.PRE.1
MSFVGFLSPIDRDLCPSRFSSMLWRSTTKFNHYPRPLSNQSAGTEGACESEQRLDAHSRRQ